MTPALRLGTRLLRRIDTRHGQHQLERDFRRLMAAGHGEVGRGDGPKVGFATFGSGTWHLVIEALLAHALAKRGARPQLLVCDLPELPICDERTIHSRDRDRCAGCVDDKRALLDLSGLPWRGVSSVVTADALTRARRTVASLADAELESHTESGRPLGRWLHVSASHFLRCDARGDAAEKVDARRRLLTAAIVVAEAVERWLDETRPDVVIAESGAHFMWRIALEAARARGLPVVCREMGKGGWDHQIYALGADSMSPDLDEVWAQERDRPLSDEEEAEVEAFLADLPARTFLQKGPAPVSRDRASLRAQFGVPSGKAVAVAFTNVTWDLATAGRDVAFTGVFDWVSATIHALADLPDAHLVIRAHPAEASVQTRERIVDQISRTWPAGLPGVTLIEPEQPLAARDLAAMADLVLVYNSTTGIEVAAQGSPVLLCGKPHFRGRGFTIDVSTRGEYGQWLATWAGGAPIAAPDGAAGLARRYTHLFFLRYHLAMGWTTSPLEPPYRLTIQSLDELQPGRNRALDEVCCGILEGRQILLPRRLPA